MPKIWKFSLFRIRAKTSEDNVLYNIVPSLLCGVSSSVIAVKVLRTYKWTGRRTRRRRSGRRRTRRRGTGRRRIEGMGTWNRRTGRRRTRSWNLEDREKEDRDKEERKKEDTEQEDS